jgi:hypothetical protein
LRTQRLWVRLYMRRAFCQMIVEVNCTRKLLRCDFDSKNRNMMCTTREFIKAAVSNVTRRKQQKVSRAESWHCTRAWRSQRGCVYAAQPLLACCFTTTSRSDCWCWLSLALSLFLFEMIGFIAPSNFDNALVDLDSKCL